MTPTTWADGRGIWHARVSRHAASPVIAARGALRDELQARESPAQPVDRRFWMEAVRVPEMDDEDTLVYREADLDDDRLSTVSSPAGRD